MLNRYSQHFFGGKKGSGGTAADWEQTVMTAVEEQSDGLKKDHRLPGRGFTGGRGSIVLIGLSIALLGLVLLASTGTNSPTAALYEHADLQTEIESGVMVIPPVISEPESTLSNQLITQTDAQLGTMVIAAGASEPESTGKTVDVPVLSAEKASLLNTHNEGMLQGDSCYFADGATKLNSNNTPRAEVTVVTGYFEMPNKHSSDEFNEWISNFMEIESFVVAFTNSNKTAELLIRKRPEALRKQLVICNVSLEDTTVFKKYGADGLQKQFAKDPEAKRHRSYALYLVWLGKIDFVLRGIELNPFKSDYFLWNDIGSFRNKSTMGSVLKAWPDSTRVRDVCGKDAVTQVLMNPAMMERYCGWGNLTTAEVFQRDRRFRLGQTPYVFTIAGSSFCGSADAFKSYADVFFSIMDLMYESGAFIGKDQTVMAQVVVSRPEYVKVLQEKTTGRRNWWLFNHLLRREGTEGPTPEYTVESCSTRPTRPNAIG